MFSFEKMNGEATVKIDLYTKAVLTVIALALVSIAIQQVVSPARAAAEPQPVIIAGVSSDAAKCLAGYNKYFGGDTGPCLVSW